MPVTPRPVSERVRELPPPAHPGWAASPVPLDAALDEDGPLDTDPLTISSSDTVPLFGLAPERTEQPGGRVPGTETDASEEGSATTTLAWLLATIALLVTLAVAGALLVF